MKEDQNRVRLLISDTISMLCKNSLKCEKSLVIQGLIGITIDDKDVFLVQINELIGDNYVKQSSLEDSLEDIKQKTDVIETNCEIEVAQKNVIDENLKVSDSAKHFQSSRNHEHFIKIEAEDSSENCDCTHSSCSFDHLVQTNVCGKDTYSVYVSEQDAMPPDKDIQSCVSPSSVTHANQRFSTGQFDLRTFSDLQMQGFCSAIKQPGWDMVARFICDFPGCETSFSNKQNLLRHQTHKHGRHKVCRRSRHIARSSMTVLNILPSD